MSDDDDTSYPVGYGKPPLATRFKPGQSGNPKGRPKGSKNLSTLVAQAMAEKVVINVGGKRKSVSKLQAGLMQQSNRLAAGDPKAMKLMMDIGNVTQDREEAKAARTPIDPSTRKPRHDAAIAALVARYKQDDDDGSDN